MTLVDTSAWVEFLRGRASSEGAWVDEAMARNDDLCTCGVIVTEVLRGTASIREYRLVLPLLEQLTYLPMSRDAYVRAANLYRAARRKGKTVRSTVDCIIATCAILHDVPLIQKDRDFEVIAGVSDLRLVQP